MMWVDNRKGSAELFIPLSARRVPVELTTLQYGDCCFVGHAAQGDVLIGIERKTIRDLIQSMTTGRLSGHQLPGLVEHFAYRWLLIEGRYRESPDGFVELPWKTGWEVVRLQYSALENYLLTVQLRAGVSVQRTYDLRDSAHWLALLYRWFTAKEWQEHRAHLALQQVADPSMWLKPNLVHRMAAQLPGIDEKAKDIAGKFPTVADMVTADEVTWRSIPGIGKVLAKRIWTALRDHRS